MAITYNYKSFITKEDVLTECGYDLLKLPLDDRTRAEEVADSFLLLVAKNIYEIIAKHKNGTFAKFVYDTAETDLELQEVIKRAQIYQAQYVLENSDLPSFNGTSENGFINLNELRGFRAYSDSAVNELADYDLLNINIF